MTGSVLITGATGFVGKNLIQFLTADKIKVFPLNKSNLLSEVRIDLTAFESIVHLAGKAHDLKKTSNPDEYDYVNYELTKKMYDSFLKSDAKKFIYISSVKAAADSFDGDLTEDVVPNPKTVYGQSKLKAEKYIQSQSLPVGKCYFILRPCMIHGPGNKGNLNLLYQFIQRGIPYPLAAFVNKRSFLSINNLCYIIKQLLIQKDLPSGIYNVSDDEALSTTEVVISLAESMRKRPGLLNIPKNLICTFAKLGDIFRLPVNTERLNKLTESYVVSNAKIKKTLNIDLPLSARDGLVLTARSFKDNE